MHDVLTIRKKTTAPKLPKFSELALPIACQFSKENAKIVTDYHKKCHLFDAKVAELHDRHSAIMEEGGDLTIRKIRELSEELVNERQLLVDRLIELRWQRFAILPLLVDDFKQSAALAKENHERGFSLAAKRFAAEGVTEASMPAGVYPEAAAIQFRTRLETELEVLRTVAPLRGAEDGLQSIKASVFSAPRQFDIPWPKETGEFGEDIERIANFGRVTPTSIAKNVLSVRIELGFGYSALPTKHEKTVETLAAKICPGGGVAVPVKTFLQREPKGFLEVRKAVESLPQTKEIVQLFQLLKGRRF